MEKICIVRRRKKSFQGIGQKTEQTIDNEAMPNKNVGMILSQAVKKNIGKQGEEETSVDGIVKDEHEIVSFNLTPEQCNLIQSSNFIQCISGQTSSGAAINVEQKEDGQISLNFHFDRVNTLRVLKTEHVCEMLQISKSFLRKLIKAGRLKSYKFGRLRRFSLEDVMEYLTKNEDFKNPGIRS